MEITIRDFVALRLREIDRHLRAHCGGTRNRWIKFFCRDTGVRPLEIRRGVIDILECRRGRIRTAGYSINLNFTRKLEKWAKENTGFESQWVLTRPSRFTTRRASLPPTTVPPRPVPPDADPLPANPLRYRLSGVPLLSPEEEDEVQADLKAWYQEPDDVAPCTRDIMSNQEPQQGDTAQCSPQSGNTLPPLPYPTDPQACGASAQGTSIGGQETLEAGGSSPEPDTPTGGGAGETPLSGSLAV